MYVLRNKDIRPHEKELQALMWRLYYEPIKAILDDYKEMRMDNAASKYPALEKALKDGTVTYSSGVFRGKFNASVSRELSTFAKYDGRGRVWMGIDSDSDPSIMTAAFLASLRRQELIDRINVAIDSLNDRIEEMMSSFQFNEDFAGIWGAVDKDVSDVLSKSKRDDDPDVMRGVNVYQQAVDAYRTDQTRNVKNWTPEQIVRLRRMSQRMQKGNAPASTFSRQVMNEWGVTERKAAFLARQETSLLKASITRTRCLDAGITKYIWRTSEDERVRDYHAQLNGKTFFFGQPPVVSKDGRRAEPGEDFNCRCVAIPLVPTR